MAIYAVGDIQGCYTSLRRLLDQVAFDPAADRLWSVGDLVNRGPLSLETLLFLMSLGDAFRMVLGNHDLHLLAMATGAFRQGRRKSLEAVLAADELPRICQWLRGQPLLHHEVIDSGAGGRQAFLMAHAGLPPVWDLAEARARAGEVESALRGPGWLDFLAGMYGDLPDTWDPTLDGMDRLRLITNYFTRMRFCDARGKLDLKVSSGPETAPPGYRPWYEFQPRERDFTLLFGHWAALDGRLDRPDIVALDTGCVWGRRLTCLRLEDRRLFSVDCG